MTDAIETNACGPSPAPLVHTITVSQSQKDVEISKAIRGVTRMGLLPLVMILLSGSLAASEPATYPLWDGVESVADYAKRVNLRQQRRWSWAMG